MQYLIHICPDVRHNCECKTTIFFKIAPCDVKRKDKTREKSVLKWYCWFNGNKFQSVAFDENLEKMFLQELLIDQRSSVLYHDIITILEQSMTGAFNVFNIFNYHLCGCRLSFQPSKSHTWFHLSNQLTLVTLQLSSVPPICL